MKQIHKKDINYKDIIFASIFNLLLIAYIYLYGDISISDINLTFIILPIVVIATFVFHEYIHIFFFKVFSNGKANIRVIREKDLGAVIMYQENKEVLYSKYQSIIILIAPLIIITILSIPFLNLSYIGLVIKVNMYLNIVGSSVDSTIIFRLLKEKNNIKINYDKEIGVIMNIN